MALRTALKEVISGLERHSETRVTRCWKLFLFFPRLLMFRPSRGGLVPKKQLKARMHQFQSGDWAHLLRTASRTERARQPSVRRRRRDQAMDVEKHAERALALVRQGELSAARTALEGAEVSPDDLTIFRQHTKPVKRPPRPRRDLIREVPTMSPQSHSRWTRSSF